MTATDPAAVALATATDPDLLRTFASLTHRLHAVRADARDFRVTRAPEQSQIADVRAQRDLVEAEILRRMGEHR